MNFKSILVAGGALFLWAGLAPVPVPAAIISGTIQYENLIFPEIGTGPTDVTELLPVRHATVQLVLFDTNSVVGSSVTDDAGQYAISANDALGVRRVYLRVLAEQNNDRLRVRVANASSIPYAMSSTAAELDLAVPHTINLTADRASRLGGTFNVFDQALLGSDYTRALSGVAPPLVTIIWYPGQNFCTCFQSSTRTIRLWSVEGQDTDEYDDDVILHEFGHAVAHAFSYDDSPGGFHSIRQRHDIRLAWSEGFATFFSGLIRGEASYIDTGNLFNSAQAIRLGYEFETPSYPDTSTGSNNELGVQAALWDCFDGGPDDDDPLEAPVQHFWEIFTGHFSPTREAQMADFYDGWADRGFADFDLMTSIMESFDMEFTRGSRDLFDRTPTNAFIPIPDGAPEGIQTTLIVPRPALIEDVRIYVSLAGSATLVNLALISPAGTRVALGNRSLSAFNSVDMAWYGPSTFPAPAEPLNAFHGENAAGTWRLEVIDPASGSGTAQLRRWELIITGASVLAGDLNGDGTVDAADLFTFSVEWKVPDPSLKPSSEKADANNDGVVDAGDLLLLYGDWHRSE